MNVTSKAKRIVAFLEWISPPTIVLMFLILSVRFTLAYRIRKLAARYRECEASDHSNSPIPFDGFGC